jgi:hypothetical protein
MPRPDLTAVLAVSMLVAWSAAKADAPADPIQGAKACLDRGDGRGAATVLEDALPTASGELRSRILESLKSAYEMAIRQAESDGLRGEADSYRENLAILNRRAKRRPKAETAAAQTGSRTSTDFAANTRSAGAITPEIADPLVRRAESETIALPSRDSRESRSGVSPNDPQPEAHTAPDPPRGVTTKSELAAADAAFVAKKYDEAGRLYGELASAKKLPKERREAWAYCRMQTVVARINEQPRTAEDWAEIQAEIQHIRVLSPKNWYAEYLRNLALERAPKSRRRDSRGVILRGSAPEEPQKQAAPARAERGSASAPVSTSQIREPAQAAPAEGSADSRVGAPGPAVGNWKVWNTPNYRILHYDDALAERVARLAENVRAEQTRRWAGSSPVGPWSPRCDIYLYPTREIFQQQTGQPLSSPGFSTMGLNSGRVVARRVNLRVDQENLLTAILPHEVTHVVLADLFTTQQVPRWADEGMAVLSEPSNEQARRALDLVRPLSSGQLFKVQDLMVMDYPNGQYWNLYYAQSVSLTRYLVELASPSQFVQFVQSSQRNGVENELRRMYKIEGYADLQKRWLVHARSTSSAALAASTPAAGETAAEKMRR